MDSFSINVSREKSSTAPSDKGYCNLIVAMTTKGYCNTIVAMTTSKKQQHLMTRDKINIQVHDIVAMTTSKYTNKF